MGTQILEPSWDPDAPMRRAGSPATRPAPQPQPQPAVAGAGVATGWAPIPTQRTASGLAGQGPVVWCARVPITACGPEEAAERIVAAAAELATRPAPDGLAALARPGVDVHQCNAYTLALADRDPLLRGMLRAASVNFADGKPVVWHNRLFHRDRHLPTRQVRGADLFTDVVRLGQEVGLRHYLLGSTPEVLARVEANLRAAYPDAIIAGAESPPFRPLTASEWHHQCERIRSSGAQVVWVGLGTPKQDWETTRLAGALPAVAIAVGAAFDFIAGTKKQAPPWMRDMGLEWLHRLASEPTRLWRRYLFGNLRFLAAVARHRAARG
ncbi:WecB/TagA/CpsF family glycosyltransferase [Frankia nepalensis]|uniref:WecB/TagA/CpsF family glycosyltransferase n=1 Tax=Frankia nepalensis TaxID=1836974 RepID=A0A937UPG5_9ACTN|nr:WecB/TagA/CpsF family glycosyltransferase [Frankia nepalensis]MBL7502672.1 WecB/TagA/CpsF family glycosyltransferase [Frankia nepalensis]MBL7516438.1 WecB/TagA/CpsF family glycosyltransferase [Frankia nepalensis]MBL7629057.1 WecB/TagA/CpsF family glycosyltransferase [Frankia nepalensis]